MVLSFVTRMVKDKFIFERDKSHENIRLWLQKKLCDFP